MLFFDSRGQLGASQESPTGVAPKCPSRPLTIRHAKPGGKTRRRFDGGGLYLEVAPSGSKWWRLKYRFGGKEERISLGVYPGVSLKQARRRRARARRLLARELDPSQHREEGWI